MEVNYLLKDELEFELARRGILNLGNVQIMKKVLKQLLSKEYSGESVAKLVIPSACEDVSPQLAICENKLRVLCLNLKEISHKPDSVTVKRVTSRLLHLKCRVELISPETDQETALHSKILNDIEECFETLSSLNDKGSDEEEDILTDADKKILQESLGEIATSLIQSIEPKGEHQRPPGSVSNPFVAENITNDITDLQDIAPLRKTNFTRTSTFDRGLTKHKLVPIKDWNIKFSGGPDISINAFLERISEIKEARNADEDDLWRYAIDLFEGDALIWFRANKTSVNNWDELVNLLTATFQSPYYQDELLEEIKKRTQGRQENVTIYMAVMQNMFNRLPDKITESQKLSILLRNLQPYLQQAVCRDVFNNVTELTHVLRVVERTKLNCDNFKEPLITNNFLEPDLAYQGRLKSGPSEVNVINSQLPQKNNNDPSRTEMKCWNCRAVGHSFRSCTLPRQRLFCYRCGKFGQSSNNCSCNATGNAKLEAITPAKCLPEEPTLTNGRTG